MTAPLPLRTTRRGALIGGLAVLATSGCDALTSDPPDGTGPVPSPSAPTATTPDDPDKALVADVRADLVSASLLVTSSLAARPGLRPELAPFGTLHARHLQALDDHRPSGREPVRGDAARVLADVRVREERLERSLASAALAAQSGPLAALLASMSAAVAQQLAATEGAA